VNPGSFCGSCGAVVKPGALYCGACGAPAATSTVSTPVPPPTMIGTIGGAPDRADTADPATGSISGPVDGAGLAGFGRRVGAYLIDGIVPAACSTLGFLALITEALSGSTPALALPLVLLVGIPLLYFVVLWVMAARGSSPGNALLGIRVVRASTGQRPGAGLGLARLLLRTLLIGVTIGIGGFSPLWDSSGRRRGWWDAACDTLVLDRDAVPAYRADAARRRTPSLADLSRSGLPVVDGPAAPTPDPAWGRAAAAVDDRPAWDLPPIPPPSRPAASPAASGPVATWGDRPATVPSTTPPTTAMPAARVSGEGPPPAVEPDPEADPAWSQPVTSGPVIRAVPRFGSAGASEQRLDHTRMRVTPPPTSPPTAALTWRLELDDGRCLPLDGPLVLGRDPSIGPDESTATLVPVSDDARSVSKTHLRLDVAAGGVQVTDRHSTNGVVIVTAGVDLRCVPGVPTPVPNGSTVRFGDRSLVVRQS